MEKELEEFIFKDIDAPTYRVPKEITKIHNQIYRDFRSQMFLEMDNSDHPTANRRAQERAIFYYISSGDIHRISQLISEQTVLLSDQAHSEIQVGDISDIPKLQTLSMLISAVTLYTRAAIDGGLPEQIAYSLSDSYIKNSLEISNVSQLTALTGSAIYDFTYEVYRYKFKDCGTTVRKCCEYILRHLHDEITLSTLADLCQKSNNYISDSFAKELHMRPIEFIRKQKLSYAKQLLELGGFSVAEISDLLAFPSTSSFISYFKKEYDMTPLKYKQMMVG